MQAAHQWHRSRTNIHHPSDSSLLSDSVRVLGRTLSRAKEALTGQTDLGEQVFRNRIRSVRRLACQVGDAMRKGGETAKTEGEIAYRKLVKAAQTTIQQARQVLPALMARETKEIERLATTLKTFIPREG